ncbi:hypothetical protein GCM10022214_50550 [Actinomadura miaoliensis]|uniref:Uncharacterized protein n=1 Tax=Actinomadura miaoliensis TaxID=430685 RepID=A0ABP7WA58_9ACTN
MRSRAEELEADPALRDGRVVLEIGSIETRFEQLVTLRMVAAVRPGPLTKETLTPARLAAAEHVAVSRPLRTARRAGGDRRQPRTELGRGRFPSARAPHPMRPPPVGLWRSVPRTSYTQVSTEW